MPRPMSAATRSLAFDSKISGDRVNRATGNLIRRTCLAGDLLSFIGTLNHDFS